VINLPGTHEPTTSRMEGKLILLLRMLMPPLGRSDGRLNITVMPYIYYHT
jgi:hypothetical protein